MRTHGLVNGQLMIIPRVKYDHPYVGQFVVRVTNKNLSKYRANRFGLRSNKMVAARGEPDDTFAVISMVEGYAVVRKLAVCDQFESIDSEVVELLGLKGGE